LRLRDWVDEARGLLGQDQVEAISREAGRLGGEERAAFVSGSEYQGWQEAVLATERRLVWITRMPRAEQSGEWAHRARYFSWRDLRDVRLEEEQSSAAGVTAALFSVGSIGLELQATQKKFVDALRDFAAACLELTGQ
jgi:hypothetical protein